MRCQPAPDKLRSGVNPRWDTVAAAWDNLRADVVGDSSSSSGATTASTQPYAEHLTKGQEGVLADVLEDHNVGQHVCVLGSKGAGKSELARAFSAASGLDAVVFYLYSELTSRDLLQRRATDIDGNTTWEDSPLIQAARVGTLCVLDGFERVDVGALTALQKLLQDGNTTLPSGELFTAHPSFRCMALGLTPSTSRVDDIRSRFLTSDLGFTFHFLPDLGMADIAAILETVDAPMNQSTVWLLRLENAGRMWRLRLNLRHLKRLHRLGFSHDRKGLYRALEDTLMVRFLPEPTKTIFIEAMATAGIIAETGAESGSSEVTSLPLSVEVSAAGDTLSIGDVCVPRRQAKDPSYVPKPLFYDNQAQLQVLQALLHSYDAGWGPPCW